MSDISDKSIDELAEEDLQVEETPAEPAKTEYIEFVGLPPYGTEFLSGHSVDRKHMKEYHDVDLGVKEVSWTKGKNGRFLVPVADMTPEAVEVFENDPMFKRVEL